MNVYPRETVEFQEVTVTVDGAPVTTGVAFAVVEDGARPATWSPAEVIGSKIGVMVAGLIPGRYRVWAQVTSSPEIPVIDCGPFQVT